MNEMLLEYEKHPEFSVEQDSFIVDKSLINSFDELYTTIKSNKKNIKSSLDKLTNIVTEIFGLMSKQTTDKYELLFLKELKLNILVLLNSEIAYYAKVKKKNIKKMDANSNLLEKDFYYFGQLNECVTKKILNISREPIKYFRDNIKLNKLTRDDLSINDTFEIWSIVKQLNKEFKKQGVLKIVSDYMGVDYKVSGLALELSTYKANWWKNSLNDTVAPKTLYAHFDQAIEYPKAIVYLSEVNIENGPTSCYPGVYQNMPLNALQELIGRIIGVVGSGENSELNKYYDKPYHKTMSYSFIKHFMRLPPELRFNSHFGWDVIPDSPLENTLMNCEKKMIGNAGTFMVFDGAKLLHRGGLVQKNERIAMQVIFGEKIHWMKFLLLLPKKIFLKILRMII